MLCVLVVVSISALVSWYSVPVVIMVVGSDLVLVQKLDKVKNE